MGPRQLHLLSAIRVPTSYPLQLDGQETSAWLNGYVVLWHPAALWTAGQPPQPSNSYDHDIPSPGFIYALPCGPQLFQPEDWQQRLETAPAFAFEATSQRNETQARLLEAAHQAGTPAPLLEAPAEVVRLFYGLGYGYLLLDALYEAADHVRLLDVPAFWQDVQAAVTALHQGEDPRPALRAAAEKLQQARQQIHPQRLVWVEFWHWEPERGDVGWPKAFELHWPLCMLCSGKVLERSAEEMPEHFAALRTAFPPNLPPYVDVGCGGFLEREDAFLPLESQLWNLRAAQETVFRLLGVPPTFYARKHPAFHPLLPAWLQHMGYRHAVLWPYPGATLPRLYSTAAHWPAPDGQAVDVFCREPLPVHDPSTFFNLAYHLYQAFTNDAAPTLALIHDGPAVAHYDDWLALAELAPVLGESIPLHRYFTDVVAGDYIGPQAADEFFVDDLDERVTQQHRPDPVSGFAYLWRWRRRLDAVFALAALHRSITSHPGVEEEKLLSDLEDLEWQIESSGPHRQRLMDEPLQRELNRLQEQWMRKLADRLLARAVERPGGGYLLFNPCNYTRRVALELDGFPAPVPVEDAVKATEFEDGRVRLVVEVPAFGYAWFPRGVAGTPPPKPRLTLAEGLTVRNEFFECDIDSTTGGIRSFRDLRRRHTRFGQQLVYQPGSRMVARDISVTHCGPALGEITSTGELVDEHDQVLAIFRQRFRAWLGRPVLEIRITFEELRHPPQGYPWHAYYGARFGWRDERAVLFRGVHGRNEATSATRPCSGDYLEVRLGSERSFLYTGGLPFLQRHGERMVDVILIPEGEQERTFDLLLSADRDLPMPTAQGWISPAPLLLTDRGPPPSGPSGWLLHVDMPNLLVTSLRPAPPGPGADRAIALRLQETSGYAGTVECRFARDPSRASRIDGLGQPLQPLVVSGDACHTDYSGDELFRVLVEWD